MPRRQNKQRAESRIMQRTIKKRRGRRRIRIHKARFITSMVIIIICIFSTGMLIKNLFSNKDKRKIEIAVAGNLKSTMIKPMDSVDIKDSYLYKQKEYIEINSNQTEIVDNEIDCDKNVDKIDNNVDNISEENSKSNNEENSSIIDEKDFNGCVFYGDSITEALSFYDTLDDSYVVGIKGITLPKAAYQSNIDKVKKLHPKKVFALLGINDVSDNISPQYFASRYVSVVKKIKRELPNTDIYIQSIFPVADKVQKRNSLFSDERIQKLNSAIKKMADEEGVNYINLFDMVNGLSEELYEPDGEHFKPEFNKIWLNYIKDNAL